MRFARIAVIVASSILLTACDEDSGISNQSNSFDFSLYSSSIGLTASVCAASLNKNITYSATFDNVTADGDCIGKTFSAPGIYTATFVGKQGSLSETKTIQVEVLDNGVKFEDRKAIGGGKVPDGAIKVETKIEIRKTDNKPAAVEITDTPIFEDLPKDEEQPKAEDKPKVEEQPKVEDKPKVEEQPKVEDKPKVEEQPKAEDKPKVEEQPKAEDKPKVEEQPKVEDKPKTEEQPKVEETPKTEEQPKVEETPKIEEQPKAEETPKTEEQPKVEDKPKVEEQPKVEETPKTEEQPKAEDNTNTEDQPKEGEEPKLEETPTEPESDDGGSVSLDDLSW